MTMPDERRAFEKERRVAALIGLFAAHDPLSAVAQQSVVRECEAGHIEEITEALAHALLQAGLLSGKIPPNAGKKKEVVDVDAACVFVAQDYANKGGVLVARSWVPTWQLASLILKKWKDSFAPPLEMTRKLVLGLPEQEVADRVCVAVLNCREKFMELTVTQDGEDFPVIHEAHLHYAVGKENLETVLVALVKATLEAFDDPNTVNHRLLHGPKH